MIPCRRPIQPLGILKIRDFPGTVLPARSSYHFRAFQKMKTLRSLLFFSIVALKVFVASSASAQIKADVALGDFPAPKEIAAVMIHLKSGWEIRLNEDGSGSMMEPLPNGGFATGFQIRRGALRPQAILQVLAGQLQATVKGTRPPVIIVLKDNKGGRAYATSNESVLIPLFEKCAGAVEAKRRAELREKMAKYPFASAADAPAEGDPAIRK